MKLWLLKPCEGLPSNYNPWEPWYDKAFGFVVRADTEATARQIADNNSGDEGTPYVSPWLDANYSTCVELLPDGEAGLILQDYHAA